MRHASYSSSRWILKVLAILSALLIGFSSNHVIATLGTSQSPQRLVLSDDDTSYSPRLVIGPTRQTHVTPGQTFVLSCQAVGSPSPRITWTKDGTRLSRNYGRVVSIESEGYLVVTDAQLSDAGAYRCVAYNRRGDVSSHIARVIVTDYSSGCADRTTDGLYEFEEVHACKGKWEGHVKRGRGLCRAGWQVCSPRHRNYLKMLAWSEVTSQLDGCYVYNAANTLNLCTPCVDGNMAGVGRDCGRKMAVVGSCLAEGRIDAYRHNIDSTRRCNYTAGVTTGVLCCKKPEKWQIAMSRWKTPKCRPRCQHGGVCVSKDRCQCADGYKGAICQNSVCAGGCIPNSFCVKPDVCRCNPGYSGHKCDTLDYPVFNLTNQERPQNPQDWRPFSTSGRSSSSSPDGRQSQPPCSPYSVRSCLNGGRCLREKCKCTPTHRGSRCQHVLKVDANSVLPDVPHLPEPPLSALTLLDHDIKSAQLSEDDLNGQVLLDTLQSSDFPIGAANDITDASLPTDELNRTEP